jgi:hypothetical protein
MTFGVWCGMAWHIRWFSDKGGITLTLRSLSLQMATLSIRLLMGERDAYSRGWIHCLKAYDTFVCWRLTALSFVLKSDFLRIDHKPLKIQVSARNSLIVIEIKCRWERGGSAERSLEWRWNSRTLNIRTTRASFRTAEIDLQNGELKAYSLELCSVYFRQFSTASASQHDRVLSLPKPSPNDVKRYRNSVSMSISDLINQS